MNSKKSVLLIILSTILLGFIGCAKEPPSVMSGADQESFQKWVEKYDPQAKLMPSGIYIRFVERGDLDFIVPKADTSWLVMNYSLFTLNGIIVETRSDKSSKLVGAWHPTTHFVDDFFKYYGDERGNYAKICEGLRDAFQYLRTGDSARIYIPVNLAYGKNLMGVNQGYKGEDVNYASRPVYFDVRLKEIVNNPWRRELLDVQKFALVNWNQTVKDSIASGLYMRKLIENPKGDSIKGDSLEKYFYAQYFLDGQLVKSNVEKIVQKAQYMDEAKKAGWTYDVTFMSQTAFQEAAADTSQNGVFAKVLLNLQRGEAAEVVATSRWSTGNGGKEANVPQILPFQPMLFRIRVLTLEEKNKIKVSSEMDLSILELP